MNILGVSESTNVGNMEQYVEQLLVTLLGWNTFSEIFVIERAHRSLAPKPIPGTPRPIIAQFLNYRDRDSALRKARELGSLRHEGSDISLFPDCMLQVQEACRLFIPPKKKLRDPNLEYSMLYPAKLRIKMDDKVLFFTDPKAVLRTIKDRELRV